LGAKVSVVFHECGFTDTNRNTIDVCVMCVMCVYCVCV